MTSPKPDAEVTRDDLTQVDAEVARDDLTQAHDIGDTEGDS